MYTEKKLIKMQYCRHKEKRSRKAPTNDGKKTVCHTCQAQSASSSETLTCSVSPVAIRRGRKMPQIVGTRVNDE